VTALIFLVSYRESSMDLSAGHTKYYLQHMNECSHDIFINYMNNYSNSIRLWQPLDLVYGSRRRTQAKHLEVKFKITEMPFLSILSKYGLMENPHDANISHPCNRLWRPIGL
jgi:hypothetical protein